jgi:hypothetical protein
MQAAHHTPAFAPSAAMQSRQKEDGSWTSNRHDGEHLIRRILTISHYYCAFVVIAKFA